MKIKALFLLLLINGMVLNAANTYAENIQNENSNDLADGGSSEMNPDEVNGIILTHEQIQAAGIIVEPLQSEIIHHVVKAPGVVYFNTYKTASITPRISAQVMDCHVVLGEKVRVGQTIVTLSSVEMAEAQGALLVADQEWKRVNKLGRKQVSENRYTQAEINYGLARVKVKAYGMTDSQISELLKSEEFSKANGIFELVATRGGTVLSENYILGQIVEPGHELIRITNESSLWVVANVPSSTTSKIHIGNNARIYFDDRVFPSKVIQLYHSLDEATQTSGIRMAVENAHEILQPGMFVDVQIEASTKLNIFAVPESAVLRNGSNWIVMIQTESGEFKSQQVVLERVSHGRAIISGIKEHTNVVVKASSFVWSELAKNGSRNTSSSKAMLNK